MPSADMAQAQMAQAKEAAPQGPNGSGNVSKLVMGINSSMNQLMSILESSGAASDEDKSTLASIIDGYQSFVSNNLGAEPGQQPEKNQGPNPVPMGGGTDMVSAGNPSAVPVHG